MTTLTDDLLRSWKLRLATKVAAPTTISYLQSVRRFGAWLETEGRSLDVASWDRYTMEAHQVAMAEKYQPGTVHSHHNALRQFMAFLIDEEEISRDPMAKVVKPKVEEADVKVFTGADVRAMLVACNGKTFADRRNHAIIMLLCDSGARRAEIANLKVSDVDLENQTAYVMGKGGYPRTITFGPQTAVAIDRYLRLRPRHALASTTDRLWLSQRGPLQPNGLGLMVAKLAAAAGVKGGHAHQFRHTWASAMKEANVQPDELKALAGWRTDAMLQKYGRASLNRRAIATGRRHSTVAAMTAG